MSESISIVILAAGKGTRLKLDVPKPLAPIDEKVLLDYVIEESHQFGEISLIVGHKKELVESHIERNWGQLPIQFIYQKKQLGTGHAVQTYFDTEKKESEYTIITCADTPLITSEVYSVLIQAIKKGHQAVCATFTKDDPHGYGRIIRSAKGIRIVEEKEATQEQKLIKEVNSGLYIFKTQFLKEKIYKLKSENNSNEFYLTDVFDFDSNVSAHLFEDERTFLGVNNLSHLLVAQKTLKVRFNNTLMQNGVRIIDPSNTYIKTQKVGESSIIYPNSYIDANCEIGRNVTIEPGCVIKNSKINDGAVIKANSYIEDSFIDSEAKVGPMAHLRPGSSIGKKTKIGNFVEIKKSTLNDKVSVSHLSYIGDAQVGEQTNIGCGFITCNYDGRDKHQTVIGKNAFIGSDCQVIAPLNIGENAYVGSGSTINKDVPSGAFAIARERQVTKEGMAVKFMKKKSDKKS